MGRPRLRRWLKRTILAILVLLALSVGGVLIYRQVIRQQSLKELEAAVRETNEADPGWQWGELVAKRAAVADDENAALVVLQVRPAIPEEWRTSDALDPLKKRIRILGSNELPGPEASVRLKEMGAACRNGIVTARTLARYRTGRFESPADPSGPEPLTYHHDLTYCADLLRLNALFVNSGGEGAEALFDVQALLGLARSIGDDPNPGIQSIRAEIGWQACRCTERSLGLTSSPSEPGVAAVQATIELEMRESTALRILRGKRAFQYLSFQILESGKVDPVKSASQDGKPMSWRKRFDYEIRERPRVPLDCAIMIRTFNQLIAIEGEPFTERDRLINAIEEKPLGEKLEPGWEVGWEKGQAIGNLRRRAHFGSTQTALACERYRLRHDSWPNSLDNLPKDLLAEVPIDPFDGRPLKYRRTNDGIVVYSVGHDRTDNEGDVDILGMEYDLSKDVGTRLWDVRFRRRQGLDVPQ